MTKFHFLILLAIISTLLFSCDMNTGEPMLPSTEVPKLEILWESNANNNLSFFGGENVHIFNDLILITGDADPSLGSTPNIPTLEAYDSSNGEKQWDYIFDNESSTSGIKFSFVDGDSFIACFNKGFVVFDLINQTEKWSNNLGSDIKLISVPIIRDGRIFTAFSEYGSEEYIVVSHDIETGTEQFHFDNAKEIKTSPIVWENPNTNELETIVITKSHWNDDTIAHALIYNESDELIHEIDNVPRIGIAFGPSKNPLIHENILIIPGDTICSAYNLISKELIWTYRTDPVFESSTIQPGYTAPIVILDKLVINHDHEDIVCLDVNTGNLLWKNEKQCTSCSMNFIFDYDKFALLFTNYDAIIAMSFFDGSTYHIEEGNGGGYKYDIVYDDQTNRYFSRTIEKVISFKLN